MYVRTYVHTYVCMYVSVHACSFFLLFDCLLGCLFVEALMYVSVSKCICERIYICKCIKCINATLWKMFDFICMYGIPLCIHQVGMRTHLVEKIGQHSLKYYWMVFRPAQLNGMPWVKLSCQFGQISVLLRVILRMLKTTLPCSRANRCPRVQEPTSFDQNPLTV